ncbi:hypothetical protein DYH09_08025 [bacterium CPR1]|nr:hypothetical protein [bacterium CPR1]
MLARDPYAWRELWKEDDPQVSEQALKALVVGAKATGDGLLVAEILSWTARAQGAQQRWDDAHDTLNDADFILMQQPACPAHARALLERARIFALSGLQSGARRLARQARERAEETSAGEVLEELDRGL